MLIRLVMGFSVPRALAQWRRPLGLALALVFVAGCGGGPSQEGTLQPGAGADVPENVFQNGSFEDGEAPWTSLTTEAWGARFQLTDEVAHSGRYSALLEMRAPKDATGAKVFGVVQEVNPPQFPEMVSGYYRVNSWQRGTQKQYLQFVVVVFGSANLTSEFPNHQIRYLLAGISEPPFQISNANFVFLNTAEPRTGEWVYFEASLHKDFQEAWGAVPEGFSMIRVLFEVRYDDKLLDEELAADVVYDDLYMGPAAANPNSAEGAWRRNHRPAAGDASGDGRADMEMASAVSPRPGASASFRRTSAER